MGETRVARILKTQINLPSFLQRSEEQIVADEQAQELRRASFSRARLTEEERIVSHGILLENIARANLDLEGSDKALELTRLSQGLEMQGKLSEAAEVHPLVVEQKRLQKIEKAIDKPDDQFCKCKPESHGEMEIHPHYEVKHIFSRKHGRMVSLVGCSKCSALNVTPSPPEQLQRILHAHRSASAAKKPTEHEAAVLR